jgi:hypothetical protein
VRPKAIVVPFFLLVAAVSQAQTSVSLTFPSDGKREIWAQAGPATKPGADSVRSEKSFVSIPLNDKKDSDNLFAWDQTTGNLAATTVGAVRKTGNWDVKAEAFKLIAMVNVRVEHAGQPLASAEVTLNDGARTQSDLLDPSGKGESHFYAVKPGSLKITARYKTKDGASKSVTQLLDASLTRSEPVPSAVISVPEDVVTAAGDVAAPTGAAGATTSGSATNAPAGSDAGTKPAPAGTADAAAPKTDNGGNAFGSFLVYLIGLAVAGGAILLALRYAKQNPDLVQGKLEQLGVDIPKPGDDTQNQQYDPLPAAAPKKPDPPQKIILDGAAPDPLASPSPMAASAAISSAVASPVSLGVPSLVSDAGDAMALPEGETVVGREVGLGLSLVGETTVSRRHAQLVRAGNEVTVTDLGSTNGTFVNGNPLQGSTILRPGDSVQFGAVRFRYEA